MSSNTTALTQRGYTVLKSSLSVKEYLKIKKELTISPCIRGAPVQSFNFFYAFRESPTKLYLPRHYGISKFGVPEVNKIPQGERIDLSFSGTLNPVQEAVVKEYLSHVDGGGTGLIQLPCGFGKTVVANYLISVIGRKTLIIVHTEMLLDQWTERMNQFLPDARIGTIRGPIIDTEDKDIVIGMLTSLATKTYDTELFEQFGFVIVDEVHHISSETFSNSLFKMSMHVMLGLSATMDRKDGTSYMFKMFLGEVVSKRERERTEDVKVRAIQFADPDNEEYSEVEVDMRGTVSSSKMITKISTYQPRSDFIVNLLKTLMEENPAQQILVLAQYKILLNYLFETTTRLGFATTAYYIGGMKRADLVQSESKQIIFGTYTMAAEGLDIKSLTTLVMASPMSSIEQPVGRILRMKHAFSSLVVDIVDSHANFRRQYNTRRQFYRSQGYDIQYFPMK